MTGLFFELGPCRVANEGYNTTFNKYSWNNDANIIFLDQPINVGFSYSDDGSTVDNSPVAGIDVYAFLELFLTRFKKYASAPFHMAGESYGGTYVPNFASIIHQKNREVESAAPTGLVKINLASVILGNGLTDPLTQWGKVPAFACDGPYPIYDDPDGPECDSLRSKAVNCQRLMKSCYNYDSRLVCLPAGLYCTQLFNPIQSTQSFFHYLFFSLLILIKYAELGLNPYDVRRNCTKEDGPLCYKEAAWLDTWMNIDSNKKALGVNPSAQFESCSSKVNQAFTLQGDLTRNSGRLLPELVNDGVRLLVYAGNADYVCNFIVSARCPRPFLIPFIDLSFYRATKRGSWNSTRCSTPS